jgi:hypothetical protein
MAIQWIIIGRYSQKGAQDIVQKGMNAARQEFADLIAKPPVHGRIDAWYAVDDHEWDVVIIGEVTNDDPAYWAKTQLVLGRATGRFEASRLLRLVRADDFDRITL